MQDNVIGENEKADSLDFFVASSNYLIIQKIWDIMSNGYVGEIKSQELKLMQDYQFVVLYPYIFERYEDGLHLSRNRRDYYLNTRNIGNITTTLHDGIESVSLSDRLPIRIIDYSSGRKPEFDEAKTIERNIEVPALVVPAKCLVNLNRTR